MVQFAIDDDEERQFWRVFKRMLQETFNDIEKYYQEAYKSKELGTVLYEQQLFPIYKVLEKNLFIKTYYEIMDGEKTLGSIPAYLKILYAIFGGGADITITQQPLHLAIDIIAPIQSFIIWVTKDNKEVYDKDGRQIVFKSILAEVTNRDLIQILKAITNAGTYIDFTLNGAEQWTQPTLTQEQPLIDGQPTDNTKFSVGQTPTVTDFEAWRMFDGGGYKSDQPNGEVIIYNPKPIKITELQFSKLDDDFPNKLKIKVSRDGVNYVEIMENKIYDIAPDTPLKINEIIGFFNYYKFDFIGENSISLNKITIKALEKDTSNG